MATYEYYIKNGMFLSPGDTALCLFGPELYKLEIITSEKLAINYHPKDEYKLLWWIYDFGADGHI